MTDFLKYSECLCPLKVFIETSTQNDGSQSWAHGSTQRSLFVPLLPVMFVTGGLVSEAEVSLLQT